MSRVVPMNEAVSRKRTRNKTFRLDEKSCDILWKEARDRGVSANEVVNELILRDLAQERVVKPRKMHRTSPLVLRLLTDSLPDEKIIEIGEKIANDALEKDLQFEVAQGVSLASILQTIKFLADICSIDYSEIENDGKKAIIMAHYVGRNYSLLWGTFCRALLASVGSEPAFSFDQDAVILRFD